MRNKRDEKKISRLCESLRSVTRSPASLLIVKTTGTNETEKYSRDEARVIENKEPSSATVEYRPCITASDNKLVRRKAR